MLEKIQFALETLGKGQNDMGKTNRPIVYSSKKIVLTEQEKEEHEYRHAREMEKRKRDCMCGGIDELGNYTRLHSRF